MTRPKRETITMTNTEAKTMIEKETKTMTMTETNTFRELYQRAILETCDL